MNFYKYVAKVSVPGRYLMVHKFNAYDRNSVIAYWMSLPELPKEE